MPHVSGHREFRVDCPDDQTLPCPSCSWTSLECQYDDFGFLRPVQRVAFGVPCDAFPDSDVKKDANGNVCKTDFDAHVALVIPGQCVNVGCGGCCTRVKAVDLFIHEGPLGDESFERKEDCKDLDCRECLTQGWTGDSDSVCENILQRMWIAANAGRRTGPRPQSDRAAWAADMLWQCTESATRLLITYTVIFRRPFPFFQETPLTAVEIERTCGASCKSCSDGGGNVPCATYIDVDRCGAPGVCCIGSRGAAQCTPFTTKPECENMDGTWLAGRGCGTDFAGVSRCNKRVLCGRDEGDCGRCRTTSIVDFIPGAVNIDQYDCVIGQCGALAGVTKPPCERVALVMQNIAPDRIAELTLSPDDRRRALGQYNFGPASVSTQGKEIDHSTDIQQAGISGVLGTPTVNPKTGYGYVRFEGFNRFAQEDDAGVFHPACETYCADPAIFTDEQVTEINVGLVDIVDVGYGGFIGEFVPYC